MNELEVKQLKVGDFVEEWDYNTIGEICNGVWKNVGISNIKEGNGLYIKWDDGDWSKIGFEYIDWSKIKKCDHGFYT